MIDKKKVDRFIGFDFVEWYERLLLVKAVIDLPKPKNGVYHQGQKWLVTQPEVASIFENGTAGFAPSAGFAPGEFGNANVWNRLMRERKLGKG